MRREACPPARPPAARPPRNAPRQTSVRREACPPARRPRRELRSAHPARPPRNAPRQTSVRRTPPDFRAAQAHVLLSVAALCAGGRRPAREIATREPYGSEWSISRPALALPPPTGTAATFPSRPRATLQSGDHDHRHRSHNPRRPHTTHQSGRRPPAPPQARTTGSQRDKTLPAQHISRSNGTKFSLLVVKRSFWPVLRMQGEFYPGYDIHGPQQGEFYPGILVAHGPHPGSAMIIHVLLARQRP